jgi:hypothetical protein
MNNFVNILLHGLQPQQLPLLVTEAKTYVNKLNDKDEV